MSPASMAICAASAALPLSFSLSCAVLSVMVNGF
jgi:hypothetical protein